MTKKLILGFCAFLLSSINFFSVGFVQPAKANTVYTDLYATSGSDTTGFGYPGLNNSDLEKFHLNNDGKEYKIKGNWGNDSGHKLELSDFKPELSSHTTIQEVYLDGFWSRNNGDINKAWITVKKPGHTTDFNLSIPEKGNDYESAGPKAEIHINLSSFLITANDLENAVIKFHAETGHYFCENNTVTWHDQLKLTLKYNNQELEGGYVWDAPDSSYFPLTSDYEWSNQTNKIAASWGEISGSEITKYKVALGTTAGNNDVCNFYNTALNTQVEFNNGNCSGFPLLNAQKYYFTVRAYTDKPGYFYEISSNGIIIDSEKPVVDIFQPLNNQYLNKTFNIGATATDNSGSGIAQVEFELVNSGLECLDAAGGTHACPYFFALDSDGSDGYWSNYNSLNVPDGKYNLIAKATDNVGNENTDDIFINIDNTPPANPTLSVTATFTQAEVSWNSDPEAMYYDLYRDGELLLNHFIGTSYLDPDVLSGQTYEYRVVAFDHLDNGSSGSKIQVTIPTPGSIIASTSQRLGAALSDLAVSPSEELNPEEGKILGTKVEKTKDSKESEEKTNNYSGWIYLLLLYILILLGYYYYYLKDEYTPWFWVFPLIVGAILLFINNSLIKVLSASTLAKMFWLWELIVFVIFCVYYQFFGRPLDEPEIIKKLKTPLKNK